jgi:hypothetical protein
MKKPQKIQDDLMKDLFGHHEVYEPSSSFTESVMYRVSMEKRYDAEIYRPVIGRTAWIVIAIFMGVLVLISFFSEAGGPGYFNGFIDYKFDFDVSLPGLTGMLKNISHFFSTASSVILYITGGLLAMTFILNVEQLLRHRSFSKK